MSDQIVEQRDGSWDFVCQCGHTSSLVDSIQYFNLRMVGEPEEEIIAYNQCPRCNHGSRLETEISAYEWYGDNTLGGTGNFR